MKRHKTRIRVGFRSYEVSCLARERESTAPAVVLLHGLQSSSEMFQGLASQSFLKKHTILAIDFLGFGDSDKPEEFSYSLREQRDVIRDFLLKKGVSHFDLIGHSMGGMVGTLLLEAKLTIKSFASLEGNLRPEDGSTSREVAALDFETFEREYFPKLKQKAKTSWLTESATAFYHSAVSIAECAAQGRILKAFRESNVQRILVRGSQSGFAALPADLAPKERVVEGSGHFLLLDAPDATFAVLKDHLNL